MRRDHSSADRSSSPSTTGERIRQSANGDLFTYRASSCALLIEGSVVHRSSLRMSVGRIAWFHESAMARTRAGVVAPPDTTMEGVWCEPVPSASSSACAASSTVSVAALKTSSRVLPTWTGAPAICTVTASRRATPSRAPAVANDSSPSPYRRCRGSNVQQTVEGRRSYEQRLRHRRLRAGSNSASRHREA